MIMKKKVILFSVIFLVTILAYLPLFVCDFNKVMTLTDEDHLYENLQAIFFLITSLIMLYLFFTSTTSEDSYLKTRKNLCYLGLFLVFFVFFGEEISWGQRILGIAEPEFMQKANAQGELNLHNLWFLQSYDHNMNQKSGLENLFTSSRLYTAFWVIFCVLIPVLNYLSSGLRRFFSRLNIPMVPFWIGGLFAANYAVQKIMERIWVTSNGQPLSEIKETDMSLLFLITGIAFFFVYRNLLKKETINEKH